MTLIQATEKFFLLTENKAFDLRTFRHRFIIKELT